MGLNHGILDNKTYWPVVKKAWAALGNFGHADGMLGYVQRIGASSRCGYRKTAPKCMV